MDPVRTNTVPLDLATIEEIRQVKYRYLRCVDLKLWDELAEVFTPDATVDYGTQVYGKPLKLAGRDEIVGFLRDKLGPDMITVHRAGQPEITVDGDAAQGTWSFEDTVIAMQYRVVITGAAFYQDRYERGADGWTVPVGGDVAKTILVANAGIRAALGMYWNAARPSDGPEGQVRLQIAMLLPN